MNRAASTSSNVGRSADATVPSVNTATQPSRSCLRGSRAATAAIVGLIISSQLVAAHPMTGETFELNAIAAAVLGGTSMSGGRGRIGGTIIGAFVIGILSDGLVMMGVSSFWQTVIKGLVIIAAVVVDQFQQRMQQRMALQMRAVGGA